MWPRSPVCNSRRTSRAGPAKRWRQKIRLRSANADLSEDAYGHRHDTALRWECARRLRSRLLDRSLRLLKLPSETYQLTGLKKRIATGGERGRKALAFSQT